VFDGGFIVGFDVALFDVSTSDANETPDKESDARTEADNLHHINGSFIGSDFDCGPV
jgi:hypothetical protein